MHNSDQACLFQTVLDISEMIGQNKVLLDLEHRPEKKLAIRQHISKMEGLQNRVKTAYLNSLSR
jgi:hypothetical protein